MQHHFKKIQILKFINFVLIQYFLYYFNILFFTLHINLFNLFFVYFNRSLVTAYFLLSFYLNLLSFILFLDLKLNPMKHFLDHFSHLIDLNFFFNFNYFLGENFILFFIKSNLLIDLIY